MNYFLLRNNFEKNNHIQSQLILGDESKKKALITIAIPTYRRAETLRLAIDSALNQNDFDNYVVLVVDNECNVDVNTEKLIKSYDNTRLYYYRNESNMGMTGNWNRCIELSDSEWITLLHDDDALLPDFLQCMFKAIECHSEIEFLISDGYICNDEDVDEKIKKNHFDRRNRIYKISTERYIRNNVACAPGLLMRRKNVFDLGGFNEEYYPIPDYAFWLNYHLKYGSFYLNDKLWIYRKGRENETSKIAGKVIKMVAEIKNNLANKIQLNSFIKEIKLVIGQGDLINGYKRYLSSVEYKTFIQDYSTNNVGKIFLYKVINKIYDKTYNRESELK